jgi:hypothetical protein
MAWLSDPVMSAKLEALGNVFDDPGFVDLCTPRFPV